MARDEFGNVSHNGFVPTAVGADDAPSQGNQVDGNRKNEKNYFHMVRGGYGLPKVSPGLAMPYPYTPCMQATPETAFS
jgi:hypothetical protein